MGCKYPITVMTNQAFFIAVAIKMVFPLSRHRLCCWHILENSRKYIGVLRTSEGFTKIFNRVLMQFDTKDEFEEIWERYEFNCCRVVMYIRRLCGLGWVLNVVDSAYCGCLL